MPTEKRQDTLHDRLEKQVLPLFTGRVLPFDLAASQACAELMARACAAGSAIGTTDGSIAAIACASRFAVATRDTNPFKAAGVPVINPWGGAQ